MYAAQRTLAGLIHRTKGGGRGNSTRYNLTFLRLHLLNPNSKEPIEWANKRCSPSHRLGDGNSAAECQKQCSEMSDSVQPTAPDNYSNSNNEGDAPAAPNGAGSRQKVEQMYGRRENLGPAEQRMFDCLVEQLNARTSDAQIADQESS